MGRYEMVLGQKEKRLLMTDSNATDVLRRMLDERGVNYRTQDECDDSLLFTYWWTKNLMFIYVENSLGTTSLYMGSNNLTPEQAIAATVGSGTLTAEQVREAIEKRFDFDVWVPPGRWQAIADELNAAVGNGTCHIAASATDGLCSDNPRQYFELSCGHSFTLDGLEAPVACPVCGKAVKR